VQENIAQVVDGIWSLQYMAAGPLCASAGPLAQFQASSAAAGGPQQAQQAQQAEQPVFTHAVLFRYANEASLERFEQQPRVQLMLGGTGAPAGTGERCSRSSRRCVGVATALCCCRCCRHPCWLCRCFACLRVYGRAVPLVPIQPPSNRTASQGHPYDPGVLPVTACAPLYCHAGITTLNFRGCVPNELEAIFRRGPEWGEGLELILAAALQVGWTWVFAPGEWDVA
jgi:hypothetical protein